MNTAYLIGFTHTVDHDTLESELNNEKWGPVKAKVKVAFDGLRLHV